MENIHFEENEFINWLQNTDYKGAISLTVKFYVKEDQVSKFHQVINEITLLQQPIFMLY